MELLVAWENINLMINKILHIGWWTSEYRGGGSILHVETLMEFLKRDGMQNYYFCGGRYNLLYPKPYIKVWFKDYTTIFELVNSPNLIWSFGNPEVHIKQKEIENNFLKVVNRVKPDVIHFHELESLTGSLLLLSRNLNIPYILDIHNYWYLCPQRDLMDMNNKICDDWEEGKKCASCLVLPTSSKVGWMYVGYLSNTWIHKIFNNLIKIAHKKRIKKEKIRKTIANTNHISTYKARRYFFISELNKVNAIIYPSKRAMELYKTYGVENQNNYVKLPINKNYLNILAKPYKNIPPTNVRFGYIGSILPHKGIHILIEAFNMIIKEKGEKCQLLIYGSGDSVYEEELKRKCRKNIFFKGKYLPSQINEVLKNIDVAVIPSLWEDCSPIVLNELKLSRTPIIGSRIGGIEEAINHGVDGYLFTPGNIVELSGYMNELIENPLKIRQFMERINFSFNIDNYINQIKEIYSLAYENNRKDK